MEDFVAILCLLIVTGFFTAGFAFSILFRNSAPDVQEVQEDQKMVVAGMTESFRKVCPVGIRKGWTLALTDCSSPRCWKKKSVFPVFKTKIMLHGSSSIVRCPALIVIDLISKPIYWNEWDSCYFSSSMSLCEYNSSQLRTDKYMKCSLVSKDQESCSENNAAMFRFTNFSSDTVRWILFCNLACCVWWFFLIQPSMRKSSENSCLLTIIHATDSVSYKEELSKAVLLRIRNIKDAAEIRSFKAYPFNPVLEHSTNAEDLKQRSSSCKRTRQEESHSVEVNKEGKPVFTKEPPDTLFQLVSSSGSDGAQLQSSRKQSSRKLSVSVLQPELIHTKDLSKTSPAPPLRKGSSLRTVPPGSLSGTGGAKISQLEIKKESQMASTTRRTKKNSFVLHERSLSTSVEQNENSDDTPENHGSKTTSPKENDTGRKESLNENKKKLPPINSNSKPIGDQCANGLKRSEGSLAMVDGTSDAQKTNSSAETSDVAQMVSLYGRQQSRSCSDLNTYDNSEETQTLKRGRISLSVGNPETDYFTVNNEQQEASSPELSDFEVLLPSLNNSEERIANLLTKGNYCASELQAEVHEACQVKTSANSERKQSGNKWTHVSSSKDVHLFLKTREERSLKILSYLCRTRCSISASRAWDIIRNPRVRFMCDETAKKVTVLEELPEQQKIIYTCHEFGGLLKKEAMDFCLLHSERVEHEKYSLAYFSIEYENCPLSSALMRGMLFPSGWVIEKPKENSYECLISYLVQVVVDRSDSLLVQESSNIVLQSIQNLRNYFVSTPENIR